MNTTTENTTAKDTLPFVFAVIALQIMGGFASFISPLILGGLTSGLSLAVSQAGTVIFVEMGALAFAALVSAPFLPRLRYKPACIIAISITLVMNLLTITVADSLQSVMMTRLIAGLCAGFVYGVSVAAVASLSSNPDRLYGIIQFAMAGGNLIWFGIGGYLSETYAHRGLFALFCIVIIVLLPSIKFMPGHQLGGAHSYTERPANFLTGVVTYIAVFIYLVAAAAMFVFSEPLGIRAGMSRTEVGLTFSVSSVVGLLGAAIAIWLNVRLGRLIPITLMVVLYISGTVWICNTTDPTMFALALIFQSAVYFFAIPYCFGLGAALDGQGRWAAAIGSAFLIGYAVGPGIAGFVVESNGFVGLSWMVSLSFVAAWILFMIALWMLNRGSRKTPATDVV
ncbi:MAG: MFS transporter [Pseudomonadales bacterium]